MSELDKFIHEKLFGECWHEWRRNSLGDRHACMKEKCLAVCGSSVPHKPSYSTDIATAFKVVEKMREKGYFFSMHGEDIRGNYFAMFILKSNSSKREFDAASTIPLAICKAAKKASEANNEKSN